MSNKLIDIVNISKAFDENVVLDELNLYIREFLYKIFFCHIGNANIFEFIVLIMFDYVTQSNYFLFG